MCGSYTIIVMYVRSIISPVYFGGVRDTGYGVRGAYTEYTIVCSSVNSVLLTDKSRDLLLSFPYSANGYELSLNYRRASPPGYLVP